MILLDTHVLIWAREGSKRLSRAASSAIRRAERDGGIAVSAITLWSPDPSDRLLGATARAEGLTRITHDEKIRRSPLLKTLW